MVPNENNILAGLFLVVLFLFIIGGVFEFLNALSLYTARNRPGRFGALVVLFQLAIVVGLLFVLWYTVKTMR